LVNCIAISLTPINSPSFANLVGIDGNQDKRYYNRVSWYKGRLGVSINSFNVGSFYQSSLTLDNGTKYVIPSMTTYNANIDLKFNLAGTKLNVVLVLKCN
jgi:hypothetical protein